MKYRIMRGAVLACLAMLCFTAPAAADTSDCGVAAVAAKEQRFLDCNPATPASASGWDGPWFTLSQRYPDSPDTTDPRPWEAFPIGQVPYMDAVHGEYLRAVLAYVLEGNLPPDGADGDAQERAFRVHEQETPRWFHAPWLDAGCDGREPIHGLTHERLSRPRELNLQQLAPVENWAVGFYNRPGGHTLRQVWAIDPMGNTVPDVSRADFPVGTVSFKLLFTAANTTQVPYLRGSPQWNAVIFPLGHARKCENGDEFERIRTTLRLVQVDVAVRQDVTSVTTGASNGTGWVFGTFMYDGALFPEDEGWTHIERRLVPVGLMWGTDPGVTEGMTVDCNLGNENETCAFENDSLRESVVNPDLIWNDTLPNTRAYVRTLGLGGRLNGPVDNPASACMSCHGRSGIAASATPSLLPEPAVALRRTATGRVQQVPRRDYTNALLERYFVNVPQGPHSREISESQCADERPRLLTRVDYSLQLQKGLESFYLSQGASDQCEIAVPVEHVAPQPKSRVTRDGAPPTYDEDGAEGPITYGPDGPEVSGQVLLAGVSLLLPLGLIVARRASAGRRPPRRQPARQEGGSSPSPMQNEEGSK